MSHIDDLVTRFDNAKTVESITAVFNDVAKLSAADQKLAIDGIENIVVSDWEKTAPKGAELGQIRMVLDIVDELKGTAEGDMIRGQFEAQMPSADVGRAVSIGLHKIFEQKGEAAHTIVKTYLEEEAKLPGGEAVSGFDLAKLMVSVQERLIAEAPQTKPASRPNPFRKPGNFDL